MITKKWENKAGGWLGCVGHSVPKCDSEKIKGIALVLVRGCEKIQKIVVMQPSLV